MLAKRKLDVCQSDRKSNPEVETKNNAVLTAAKQGTSRKKQNCGLHRTADRLWPLKFTGARQNLGFLHGFSQSVTERKQHCCTGCKGSYRESDPSSACERSHSGQHRSIELLKQTKEQR